VALTTTDGAGQTNVAIYDLSGAGALRRLTLEGNNRFPIWSTDGQRIAFQSDREGDRAIYWQRADGTTMAERLTRPGNGASHVPGAWFPDGMTMLFIENRDDTNTLWVFFRSDGKTSRFSTIQSRAPLMSVALSPDARWVAYTSLNELFVQPFPATGAVYPVASPGAFPRWSANGRELVYQVLLADMNSIGITTQPGIRLAGRCRWRPKQARCWWRRWVTTTCCQMVASLRLRQRLESIPAIVSFTSSKTGSKS
jgi:hypothetical protein